MIIFAVKQIEIDNIHADRLTEFAVICTRFQIFTVQLRPVKQRAFLVGCFFVDLHLNIYFSAIHNEIQVKTTEFLVDFLRRKLHVLDLNVCDPVARDIQHIRNKCCDDLLVLFVAENTLKNDVDFQFYNFFIFIQRNHAPSSYSSLSSIFSIA